jgi:hypothetical protein
MSYSFAIEMIFLYAILCPEILWLYKCTCLIICMDYDSFFVLWNSDFCKSVVSHIDQYNNTYGSFPGLKLVIFSHNHVHFLFCTLDMYYYCYGSTVLPFSECHKIWIIAFSDWLFSFNDRCLRFMWVIQWFVSLFFVLMKNIALNSMNITVVLFIHLLKEILVASWFGQLWINIPKHSCSSYVLICISKSVG